MPQKSIFATAARAALAGLGCLSLAAIAGVAATPAHAQYRFDKQWTNLGGSTGTQYGTNSALNGRQYESHPPTGFATLTKQNIGLTKSAVQRYEKIAASGGWPEVPASELKPGTSGREVEALSARLVASGDMGPSDATYRYNYQVAEAVKRYQKRNGLTPTGTADKATIMALNVPARTRLAQLKKNVGRLQSLVPRLPNRYIFVNIPAAQIEAVENGHIVSRHSGVVGKIDRKSPVLHSNVAQINFNPYWHVPVSIVHKDLVPKARQFAAHGKDILAEYKIDAFDSKGRKIDSARINWFSKVVYSYHYRQQPWDDNSMGFVKINFHNPYSVYMHDTPSDSLFGRNYRAKSSGCVRIQNVEQLVTWILDKNPGWDRRHVLEMKENGERKDVSVKAHIGVYFDYVTAWATPDGVVHFRRDLYRKDGVGVQVASY